MKLLISPAKKMRQELDFIVPSALPAFLSETRRLLAWLRDMPYESLKKLLGCGDTIAKESYARFASMDLENQLTPALFAYDGIQYTYMSPGVFTYEELDYIDRHLRILSGFYGLLRPFDGVVPYRLEMQARLSGPSFRNLYQFWGDKLCRALAAEDTILVNLASAEYSRAIEPFLPRDVSYITCRFGQVQAGKFREKGVHVKMARGQMVRYLAENQVEEPAGIKGFDRLGYGFAPDLSDDRNYYFVNGGD